MNGAVRAGCDLLGSAKRRLTAPESRLQSRDIIRIGDQVVGNPIWTGRCAPSVIWRAGLDVAGTKPLGMPIKEHVVAPLLMMGIAVRHFVGPPPASVGVLDR